MPVLVDLEEFGFEDVRDFERFENMFNNLHELYIKEKQKNQALKERWEKLKKMIIQGSQLDKTNVVHCTTTIGILGIQAFCEILLKDIEELEKGGK